VTEAPSRLPMTLAQAFEQATRYQHHQRWSEAEELYRQILASKPDVASAWQNLGLLFAATQRKQQALECLSRALSLQPDLPALRIQQAILLHQAGQIREALALLQRHLARQPDDAVAWYNLAVVTQELEGPEAALPPYRRVLALHPDHHDALSNIAQAYRRLGQIDQAIEHFEILLRHCPDHAEAHFHLASCRRHRGDLAGAVRHYRCAIAARPNFGPALSNLGNLLKDRGDYEEARACLQHALAVQPDLPEALFNQAILDLIEGDLATGWPGMARRWQSPSFPSPARHFACPPWQGQELHQRRLLVWGEQGVGDEIILAQMIPDIAARTADCLVECDPRLVPLLSRSFPDVTIIPRNDPANLVIPPRPVDYHCSLVDLGPLLRSDFRSFPRHTGYLRPPTTLTTSLKARYRVDNGDRPVIGLSWSSTNPAFGREKSVALADLAPILTACPARFVSLQYGADPADIAATAKTFAIDLIADSDIDPLIDLDAFAAQVSAMDLIITTSNTTAHMAGALGKPCWVLVPTGTGLLWYWFLDRSDSPWYPSLTLFRQPRNGDWTVPLQTIAERLGRRADYMTHADLARGDYTDGRF